MNIKLLKTAQHGINKKGSQITAKGPQDCVALTPEQFAGAMSYVAKAFMSATVVPKEFFTGIPVSSSLSQDSVQRTLLAAFAHYKQNGSLALSFFCRYKALLELRKSADLTKWVFQEQSSEYAIFSPSILSLAAGQPLLSNGKFDAVAFMAKLRELSCDSNDPELEKPSPDTISEISPDEKVPLAA